MSYAVVCQGTSVGLSMKCFGCSVVIMQEALFLHLEALMPIVKRPIFFGVCCIHYPVQSWPMFRWADERSPPNISRTAFGLVGASSHSCIFTTWQFMLWVEPLQVSIVKGKGAQHRALRGAKVISLNHFVTIGMSATVWLSFRLFSVDPLGTGMMVEVSMHSGQQNSGVILFRDHLATRLK